MAIIKQRLKRYNGSTYDTIHLESDITNLAPEFSTTTAYGVGDYVTYNWNVYRCTTAHSAGAWNSSHFTEVKAVGQYVTAGKLNGTTLGSYATAEGSSTVASNDYSHAEGYGTTASGSCSHAEGESTTASEEGAHSEGVITYAAGFASHSEGMSTEASGLASHAEGGCFDLPDQKRTVASGEYSHAEGEVTTASGKATHSEGGNTTASYYYSHAEGFYTTASGAASHAEGSHTTANHVSQHVFGEYNAVDSNTNLPDQRGDYVEIVGNGTSSASSNARTLDWSGNEQLQGALYVNTDTTTSTLDEDNRVATLGVIAPAFSTSTNYNRGDYVTYEGKVYRCTTAHSAGAWNSSHFTEVKAVGQYVTAGKKRDTTLGASATAEGVNNTASGSRSHAEGYYTTASGSASHAEGSYTTASGVYSHAEGSYTTANHKSQHVFGEYNIADSNVADASSRGDYVEIVGNGTFSDARSNARTLDWNGNEVLSGSLTATKVNAASNDNLLDNWYFVGGGTGYGVFPVNQRGLTQYSGDILFFDRWRGSANITATLEADGVTVSSSAASGGVSFTQRIINNELFGKTVTGSILTSTGILYVGTGVCPATPPSSGNSYAFSVETVVGTFQFAYVSARSDFEFTITLPGAGRSIKIVAAKLELGNNQTLAHQENGVWVLNELPDYKKELFKCQTSTAEPSDAYSYHHNLVDGMASPNKNYIDNGYFIGGGSQQGGEVFPINRRRLTTYNNNGLDVIDRWKLSRADRFTITLSSDCLRFERATSGNAVNVSQTLRQPLSGSCTISALVRTSISSGSAYIRIVDRNGANVDATENASTASTNIHLLTATSSAGAASVLFGASSYTSVGDYMEILAIYLEQGTTQTVFMNIGTASSPNWQIKYVPDYQEELFKCQTAVVDSADVFANSRNLVEGMAKSNHNYIRNWYFIGGGSQQGAHQFPLNSRGKTSYTRNEFAIDCWYLSYGSNYNYSLDIGSSGLTLSHGSTGSTSFQQYIPEHGVLSTTVCTISAIISGELYSVTIYPFNSGSSVAFGPFGLYTLPAGTIIIRANPNASGVISAVKLETGTTQTLARKENGSWVINDIPDYEQELFKCQTFAWNDNTDLYSSHRNLVEGMAKPNPNLLVNSYFVGGGSQQGDCSFPINQRTNTTYSAAGYTIDCWKIGSDVTVDVNTTDKDGLILGGTNSQIGMGQYIPLGKLKAGEVYTLSALLSDGTLYTNSGTLRASTSWQIVSGTYNANGLAIRQSGSSNVTAWHVGIWNNVASRKILAIKLERGIYQTLAHNEGSPTSPTWVLNEVPDYEEELRKCQANLQIIKPTGTDGSLLGSGYVDNGADTKRALFTVPLSVPMRPITSVTSTGVGVIQTGVGNKTIDAIALFCQTSTLVTLNATLTTAISSPSYAALTAYVLNGGSVIISAEL